MKKFMMFFMSIMLVSLMTQVSTFAQEEAESTTSMRMNNGTGTMMQGSGSVLNAQRNADKEMLKAKRDEMKMNIDENHTAAQANRDEFRAQNGDELDAVKIGLTAIQKVQLLDLQKTFKSAMDTFQEKIKTTAFADRPAVYKEMKVLAEQHYTDLKNLLGASGSVLIDERKAVFEENETLRNENRTMRKEFNGVKQDTVEKYRRAFVIKLGTTFDQIPTENLSKIQDRIDTLMTKYESDINISDTKKETMLAALTALSQMIQDRIDGIEVQSDVLDVVNSLIAQ